MDKNLYILAKLDEETQDILKKYEKIILGNGFMGKIYKQINILYSGFGLFGINVPFL